MKKTPCTEPETKTGREQYGPRGNPNECSALVVVVVPVGLEGKKRETGEE